MSNKSITVESLHAEYAERLAAVVGLNVAEYPATPDGLASLLTDTAGRLSPLDHNREYLGEAAAEFEAVSRLGGGGGGRLAGVVQACRTEHVRSCQGAGDVLTHPHPDPEPRSRNGPGLRRFRRRLARLPSWYN